MAVTSDRERGVDNAGRKENSAALSDGSWRPALFLCTVLLGGYSLFVARVYLFEPILFEGGTVVFWNSVVVYIIGCMNIILIFSILMDKAKLLEWILNKVFTTYVVCSLVSFLVMLYFASRNSPTILFLESIRFIGGLVLLYLIHPMQNVSVSETELRPQSPVPAAGWITRTLAQRSPEPLTADNGKNDDKNKEILKEHTMTCNAPAAPTSCSNLAPVHCSLSTPATQTTQSEPPDDFKV